MPKARTIYLAVSLDVEEEGLFCGSYATRGVTVANTASLHKLIPFADLGIRPTLFCAHPVFLDPASRDAICAVKESMGAEIAAHLHHWNTPPFLSAQQTLKHVPSWELSDTVFSEKLASVLDAAKRLQKEPVTSFRMGRWDIHRNHFPLLAKAGVLTDASVRPLHGKRLASTNPNHFTAPSSPYWIPTQYGHLFEVPLTVTPILRSIVPLLKMSSEGTNILKVCSHWLQSTTNYWGALALLPAYHPLWIMQLVTRLYIARGGFLLSLTWHSSEMHAGATPHIKTEGQTKKLLGKVRKYVEWLRQRYVVHCLPMNELRNILGARAPRLTDPTADWTVADAVPAGETAD